MDTEKIKNVLEYFLTLDKNTGIFDFYHRDDRRIHWDIMNKLKEILNEINYENNKKDEISWTDGKGNIIKENI